MHEKHRNPVAVAKVSLPDFLARLLYLRKALHGLSVRAQVLFSMSSGGGGEGLPCGEKFHIDKVLRSVLRRLDALSHAAKRASAHAIDLGAEPARGILLSNARIEWLTGYRCVQAQLIRIESDVPRVRHIVEGLAREFGPDNISRNLHGN